MATGFKRASGCKYPKCNVCGHDKILDAETCKGPSSQVVGGKACPYCNPPEGLEFNISCSATLIIFSKYSGFINVTNKNV